MGIKSSTRQLLGADIPEENYYPSTNSHQLPITPQMEVGLHKFPIHAVILAVLISCRYPWNNRHCESTCAMALSCPTNTFLAVDTHYFWLAILPSLFHDIPRTWVEGYGVDVTFRTEYSLVFYSMCISHLGVSALIVAYCKKEILWWGLRDAQIYGQKHKNLGGSLVLHPFSRVRLLGSPLILIT